ncbi:MAG: sporulation membrane protein YtaF [Firmicutes bacterium]|nr:sporulation membrane protein YtaF [Bacillota bacterium]
MVWYSLLIALAISIDSFSIGVAYGIKEVKIPLLSLIIINILCVGVFSISLLLGNLLFYFISYGVAKFISAMILISLGGWLLLGVIMDRIAPDRDHHILLKKIRIKPLGIVINILKEPSAADMDVSGNIDHKEACLLGIALSLDSLGVGIGASLGNHALYAIGFLALFNWLFLIGGMKVGKYYSVTRLKEKVRLIPPLILICLGTLKLF